jgi:hypothetical protein
MTEKDFKKVFTQFLNNYWGAFHEALEAQSVTPRRLARSLFEPVQAEHHAFAAMYAGPAKGAVDRLSGIWREVAARAYEFPDPAFTREEASTALRLFGEVYDSLVRQGEAFADARHEIVRDAAHGTPKDPLRADVAR